MRRVSRYPLAAAAVLVAVLAILAAACAPPAAPTPTPTKAAPAATPTTAAPKVEATKPAEKPAATPTAAPAGKPTGKPIKVCFLTPLSGPLASVGWPQSVAVKMADEDINRTGGINGSPWEVLMKDSPFDARQSVTVFRECAEKDQVVAVFGPYSSAEFDQAAPLSGDLKVPVVGATTTKVGAVVGHPYAFRMTITDDISIAAAVKAFAKAHPNVKKMVIIGDIKEAVTEPVAKKHFPDEFKNNGLENLGLVEFTRGMTDMGAVVTKAKELNPDGLGITALPGEWALLAKELNKQGVKLPVMVSSHPWPGNTVWQVKDDVEGMILAAFFQEDLPAPEQQAWVKRFKQIGEADTRIPKPLYAAVEPQMYDAMMASAKVLRDARVTGDTPLQQARDVLRKGLEELKDYKGVVRTYTMNKDHDATGAAYPVVAKNGRWELLR